jgi:hypothetical protein
METKNKVKITIRNFNGALAVLKASVNHSLIDKFKEERFSTSESIKTFNRYIDSMLKNGINHIMLDESKFTDFILQLDNLNTQLANNQKRFTWDGEDVKDVC